MGECNFNANHNNLLNKNPILDTMEKPEYKVDEIDLFIEKYKFKQSILFY